MMSGLEVPKQVRDDKENVRDDRETVFSSEITISSVQSELEDLFENFAASSAYQELKGAEILGREVPFTIPWNGQVMEGVIDIIYRCGDKLYAADYKTDRVREGDREAKFKEYSVSVDIYMKAVRMCTGSDLAGFKLIFLRQGTSVKE